MNSFSSASQMCEPFPRTINGGSPPTEPNARTGEFTPPGIMLSARCCKRRDCSTFRDVVDGIVAPTLEKMSTDDCACCLSFRTSVLCAVRKLGEPRDGSRSLRPNKRVRLASLSQHATLRASDYYSSAAPHKLIRYSRFRHHFATSPR